MTDTRLIGAIQSWGGRETVMETKFDVWWKEHWSDLFGFPEGQPETAQFHTQSTPRADDLRTTTPIYENLYRGDYWTVGCYVRHIEEKKGRKVAKSLIMLTVTFGLLQLSNKNELLVSVGGETILANERKSKMMPFMRQRNLG